MDHISFQSGVPVATRERIANMRVFDGEDQGLGNRVRMQQMQQEDWIKQ